VRRVVYRLELERREERIAGERRAELLVEPRRDDGSEQRKVRCVLHLHWSRRREKDVAAPADLAPLSITRLTFFFVAVITLTVYVFYFVPY
jgi:hypothetical protein